MLVLVNAQLTQSLPADAGNLTQQNAEELPKYWNDAGMRSETVHLTYVFGPNPSNLVPAIRKM